MTTDEHPGKDGQVPAITRSYRFGPFRLDTVKKDLWRAGNPVPLSCKEFEVLLKIVEKAPAPSTTEYLLQKAWCDTNVTQNTVARTIFRIRQRLGLDETGQEFIRTRQGEGYALAVEVHRGGEESDLLAVPTAVIAAKRQWHRIGIPAAMLLLVGAAAIVVASRTRPEVTQYTQVTNDGYPKSGPILDGDGRFYFVEEVDEKSVVAWATLSDRQVTRSLIPGLTLINLLEIRHGELLLRGFDTAGVSGVFRWRPGNLPERLREDHPGYAAWLSDSRLLLTTPAGFRLVDSSGQTQGPEVSLPGRMDCPSWSPALGLLRFTLWDPKTERVSIWQMQGTGSPAHPVPGFPAQASDGSWTPDGGTYVFTAKQQGRADIWTAGPGGFASPNPWRLTNGPLSYSSPRVSADGNAVFAIGEQAFNEMVRYDATNRQFLPFTPAWTGVEADFSQDGEWVVYASDPERTLWKMRRDGTQRKQLTSAPLTVTQPHWSPDGARIAFMGQYPGKPFRIYVIPTDGGNSREVARYDRDQGVPTWSPQGDRVVFGEHLNQRPHTEMALHYLNLADSRVTTVPGSYGLFTPRWSPDGRFILAQTPDFRTLKMFNVASGVWQELITFRSLDHPKWSADSAYVHFMAVGPPGGTPMPVRDRALYRIHVASGKLERLADLAGFQPGKIAWYGVDTEGGLLATRSRNLQEIYQLTLKPR